MQRRLLFTVAAGVLVASGSAVWSLACDKEAKVTAATASNARACTAEMAAKCTPAQAAACKAAKARGATAAAANGCAGHAAVTANVVGKGSCTGAATAARTGAQASAVTANAAGACAHDGGGKVTAMAAGSSCRGKGMSGATAHRMNHADCDACAGLADCDGELKASGALTQVVKLKNGIMYVYTVQEPGKVRAIQSAVTQRYQRLQALQAAGDKAKLCPECKTMRGALASGKLSREMVTIEGGCMTLVTSSDRSIVNKLHGMVEPVAGRVKI